MHGDHGVPGATGVSYAMDTMDGMDAMDAADARGVKDAKDATDLPKVRSTSLLQHIFSSFCALCSMTRIKVARALLRKLRLEKHKKTKQFCTSVQLPKSTVQPVRDCMYRVKLNSFEFDFGKLANLIRFL